MSNIIQTAQEEVEVHKSRWGYHACSWEVYRMLKELNHRTYNAWRQYKAWKRWDRKMPHNRLKYRWIRDENGQKIGREILGPKSEPYTNPVFVDKREVLDGHASYVAKKDVFKTAADFDRQYMMEIWNNYNLARYPVDNPKDVKKLSMSVATIQGLLDQLNQEKERNPCGGCCK